RSDEAARLREHQPAVAPSAADVHRSGGAVGQTQEQRQRRQIGYARPGDVPLRLRRQGRAAMKEMAMRKTVALTIATFLAAAAARAAEDAAVIQKTLNDAHTKFQGVTEGKNADYIPALAKVDSSLFGIALVTTDGKAYSAGEADSRFSIQSI